MIIVHELGHFWAALSVGIKVETFSLGFGPRLFGVRRGETDFRVSAIPFGGYVRMLGEQPGDEPSTDPRSFQAKARWQRALVVLRSEEHTSELQSQFHLVCRLLHEKKN